MAAADNNKEIPYTLPKHIPTDCFRTYDIRGAAGDAGITPELAYAIGLAIGAEALALGEHEIIVGRDGRLSGPVLTEALCAGICDTGIDVLFIGEVPTPVVYFATYKTTARSGVMVTASHNPGHHNGFKIVLAGQTLNSEGIAKLLHRIQRKDFVHCAEKGTIKPLDNVADDYLNYITQHITLAKPLRVVVDCGNGVAGHLAPRLYEALGCEVIPLFCEVDGHFPNHHPDPTVPENLISLQERVRSEKADIGLALDGDGDRLGIVTNTGEIIWPDRQMMLYAIDVLEKHPHAQVIFDVKCSRQLATIIRLHGGHPLMWRTGHSLIKAKLMETGAPLAGEMSGHIFFNDEWFGFDDGLYVGARLLQILSQRTASADAIFKALPNSVNTPELKVPLAETEKQAFMTELLTEADFPNATRITLDGLRVEFSDGWGLIRPSNTSPYLIVRFEADTQAGLERIQALFRAELLKITPSLQLPW